jgi:hypothetical protein
VSSPTLASGRDEDENPRRVGRLERVQPISLLTDTLEHQRRTCPGTFFGEVQERRHGSGRVVATKGKTLEG